MSCSPRRDRALLSPSPANIIAGLAPASGRQDHTPLPSAAHQTSFWCAASTASRLACRDVRETLLLPKQDGRRYAYILIFVNRKIVTHRTEGPNRFESIYEFSVLKKSERLVCGRIGSAIRIKIVQSDCPTAASKMTFASRLRRRPTVDWSSIELQMKMAPRCPTRRHSLRLEVSQAVRTSE
jgi:hypothetical protein